ncbi:MAG: M20 metallopeptidase family protein [Eubacteriaceae bacterium]
MIIRQTIRDLEEEIKHVRRELHTIPEEGFKEFKTSNYIYNYLVNIGVELVERVANTGIVALIQGKNTLDTIAYRADMDGLSIKEKNNITYSSVHVGMMHACGHDGHMTSLLVFAKYIIDNKIIPKNNILLIFQPAEEGPGGADIIIKEGILKKYSVKKIYGCHIMPSLEEGYIGCKPGPMMAQTGEFYIKVKGKSAHAAVPHKGVDAIIVTANLINSLQTIVSRNMDPMDTTLVSIGTISGGQRVNVIAEEVEISGTMRAFNESIYNKIKNRFKSITSGYEESFDCKIDCEVIDMYPPVINNNDLYEQFKNMTSQFKYKEILPMMIAEDFSYYQKEIPGLFFYIGSKNIIKDYVYELHHCKFNFDEKILLNVMEIYAKLAETL